MVSNMCVRVFGPSCAATNSARPGGSGHVASECTGEGDDADDNMNIQLLDGMRA